MWPIIEREKIAGHDVAKILFLIASCKTELLRFSYQHQLLCVFLEYAYG